MESLRVLLINTYKVLKNEFSKISRKETELRDRLMNILIEINSLEYEIRAKQREENESNSNK